MNKVIATILCLVMCHTTLAQKKKDKQSKQQMHHSAMSLKEYKKQKALNKKNVAKVHFQYFVTKADSNTYGYSIFANGNYYIEQRTIPGKSGTVGFADTATSAAVARLVIQKIKEGELPPTISNEELEKIAALQKN